MQANEVGLITLKDGFCVVAGTQIRAWVTYNRSFTQDDQDFSSFGEGWVNLNGGEQYRPRYLAILGIFLQPSRGRPRRCIFRWLDPHLFDQSNR